MYWLRNLIISSLIFILGGVIGFRYATGELPLVQAGFDELPRFQVSNTFQPADVSEVNFQNFWEVWRLIQNNYYDPSKFNDNQLVDSAIKGLAAGTGDPYTVYQNPEQRRFTDEQLQGSFYGVGIQLGYVEGVLAAVAPLKDSPAEQAGVQAGDLIIRVKDDSKDLNEETTGWSLDEAVSYIRGPRNTEVTLELFRRDFNDNRPFEVVIARGEIKLPAVELSFVEHADKRVAHLQVAAFNEETKPQWDEAVSQILAQSDLDGVILDFRNNPGGLLDQAVIMASDFIARGENIVTQAGRTSRSELESTGGQRLIEFPLEILVNKGSASASEIVAGALRDQIGAKLIGTQTFGKGTVQDRLPVSNGGAVHVTIARWLLPGGDWIQDEGIPVDIEVEDNPDTEEDEVLLRAIEEL